MRRACTAMLASVVVLACNDGPTDPSTVATVTVTPGQVRLDAIGASQLFTATATYGDGSPAQDVAFSWSSSAPGVVAIDSTGLGVAIGPGEAAIRATAEGVAGSADVTVTQVAAALVVTLSPGDGLAGLPLTPSPVVEVRDANDHLLTVDDGRAITASLAGSTGALSGTLSIPTSNGVASFADLAVMGPPADYELVFSAAGLPDALSAPVAVRGELSTVTIGGTVPDTIRAGMSVVSVLASVPAEGPGVPVPEGVDSVLVMATNAADEPMFLGFASTSVELGPASTAEILPQLMLGPFVAVVDTDDIVGRIRTHMRFTELESDLAQLGSSGGSFLDSPAVLDIAAQIAADVVAGLPPLTSSGPALATNVPVGCVVTSPSPTTFAQECDLLYPTIRVRNHQGLSGGNWVEVLNNGFLFWDVIGDRVDFPPDTMRLERNQLCLFCTDFDPFGTQAETVLLPGSAETRITLYQSAGTLQDLEVVLFSDILGYGVFLTGLIRDKDALVQAVRCLTAGAVSNDGPIAITEALARGDYEAALRRLTDLIASSSVDSACLDAVAGLTGVTVDAFLKTLGRVVARIDLGLLAVDRAYTLSELKRVTELGYIRDPLSSAERATVTICQADGHFVDCRHPVFITPPTVTDGTVGVPYELDLDATGGDGAYDWEVAQGPLPDGLVLSGDTIRGTPTRAGVFPATIQVTSGTQLASLDLQLVVRAPLVVETTWLPSAVQNETYSYYLSATGGDGNYTWSVALGSLPPGMGLEAATGEVFGVPVSVGSFAFSVEVVSGDGRTAQAQFSLSVNARPPPLITGATLDLIAPTGGGWEIPFTIVLDDLGPPSPVFQGSNGGPERGEPLFSGGVPPGAVFYEVRNSTGNGFPNRTDVPYVWNRRGHSSFIAILDGQNGRQVWINASAGVWSTDGTNWEYQVRYHDNGLGTASMEIGTVPNAGVWSLPLTVTDFDVVVADETLRIVTRDLSVQATGVVGTDYAATLGALGGGGQHTWVSLSGAPPGLSLSTTGDVSGIPTQAGTFSWVVRVTGSDGQVAEGVVTVTVHSRLTIATVTVGDGVVGVPYDQPLQASGGDGTYSWSLLSGQPPAGLTVDSIGRLVGTPSQEETQTFAVEVVSGDGQSATQQLTVAVIETLAVTTVTMPHGVRGAPYSATLSATGGYGAYGWALENGSGPLPPGLQLSTTGSVSGVPTASGAFTFTVEVTSLNRVATQDLAISVYEPLTVSTSSLPPAAAYVSYSDQLEATGGDGQYTWGIRDGFMPPGIVLAASGSMNGIAATEGVFDFTAEVTSGDGQTATMPLFIEVIQQPVVLPTESCRDFPDFALVTFEDPNLRNDVLGAMALEGLGNQLTCAAVSQIQQLKAQPTFPSTLGKITSLNGIQNLTGLTRLNSIRNTYVDAGPIGALTSLTYLQLGDNGGIEDLTPLSTLTNLDTLLVEIVQPTITDLDWAASLTNLKRLMANADDGRPKRGAVADISGLAGLTLLEDLAISRHVVSDISVLSNMTRLHTFRASSNRISDLSPLQNLSALEEIDLDENAVTDPTPLSGLTNLRRLLLNDYLGNAGDMAIPDLSPLQNLTQLEMLWVSGPFPDLAPLAGLTNLARLSVQAPQVTDLRPLSGLTRLYDVTVEQSLIASLSGVESLTSLNRLRVGWNPNLVDIQALFDNPGISAGDIVDLTLTAVDCAEIRDLATATGAEVRDSCPYIVTTSLPPAYLDDSYEMPWPTYLVARGGRTPGPFYSFSVVAGSLPPGMTLGTDGVFRGTPTVTGTWAFTARVTDSFGGYGDKELTLEVHTRGDGGFELGTLGIRGAAVDPTTGHILVAPDSTGQIIGFAPDGQALGSSVPAPGTPTELVDLDFFEGAATLGGTAIPANSLLVTAARPNGAELYAIDPSDGAVLDSVSVGVGGSVVGASYHPTRGTIFLVAGGTDLVTEVDPATGAVLSNFAVQPAGSPLLAVATGDIDVDAVSGKLLIATQDRIRVLTPDGVFDRDLEHNASNQTFGFAFDSAARTAWVTVDTFTSWLIWMPVGSLD